MARLAGGAGGTVFCLAGADVVALAVAGAATLALTGQGELGQGEVGRLLAFDVFLVPLAAALASLYPASGVSRSDELRRLTYLVAGTTGILIAPHVLTGEHEVIVPLLVMALLAIVALPLGRAWVRFAFDSRPWWGAPTVIVGAGEDGAALVQRLARYPSLALRPVAFFDDDVPAGSTVEGLPVVGPVADVGSYRDRGVQHVIVVLPRAGRDQLLRIVRRHVAGFRYVTVVPDLRGFACAGVQTRTLGGMVALHVHHNLLFWHARFLKGLLDVLLLVPLTVMALPVVLIAAAWVALASPGNPFYAQERVGLRGRTFRLWKLRTMHVDAEALLERHLAEHPEARAEWERHYKLRHDPRVIPGIGDFLRRTSLDELPQLLNIARGEMSFVGPRPFPEYHLRAFGEEFRELRQAVRPGLTGAWQVSARASADLELQEELDTLYISNWSLWVDIYMLARTAPAVLSRSGAF
jgi:Undecaprenyl-phosphate galactose phosphotransferase WbaP